MKSEVPVPLHRALRSSRELLLRGLPRRQVSGQTASRTTLDKLAAAPVDTLGHRPSRPCLVC